MNVSSQKIRRKLSLALVAKTSFKNGDFVRAMNRRVLSLKNETVRKLIYDSPFANRAVKINNNKIFIADFNSPRESKLIKETI